MTGCFNSRLVVLGNDSGLAVEDGWMVDWLEGGLVMVDGWRVDW